MGAVTQLAGDHLMPLDGFALVNHRFLHYCVGKVSFDEGVIFVRAHAIVT